MLLSCSTGDNSIQVLTANPKDVDALCGYACFLSTVKEDYAGASELYRSGVRERERERETEVRDRDSVYFAY